MMPVGGVEGFHPEFRPANQIGDVLHFPPAVDVGTPGVGIPVDMGEPGAAYCIEALADSPIVPFGVIRIVPDCHGRLH